MSAQRRNGGWAPWIAVWTGVALTVTVVGGILVWLWITQVCAGSAQSADCLSGMAALKTLTPNEIGDTLAGLAGSLAFIWLIVTVWIQSAELAAQRAEFSRLNRNARKERKQTQVFFLIDRYNQNVESMCTDYEREKRVVSGRDAFRVLHERLHAHYEKILKERPDETCPSEFAFKVFWKNYSWGLEPWIEFSAELLRSSGRKGLANQMLLALLKANMTKGERVIMFYYCVNNPNSKSVLLLKDRGLLELLPQGELLDPKHIELLARIGVETKL